MHWFRAYDSNFCFDIWRITNADYLLTYLLTYVYQEFHDRQIEEKSFSILGKVA